MYTLVIFLYLIWECSAQVGHLGKPPASLNPLPSRANSRKRFSYIATRKCWYEAIRVWSHTTLYFVRVPITGN